MAKPEFVYVQYIATTPEKLFGALTSAEFSRQYWGGRQLQSEWKVGAPVKALMPDGVAIDWQGEVLRYEPPRVLSYTFHVEWVEEMRRERPSRVTFEIAPWKFPATGAEAPDIVRLTVTHDEFPPESVMLPGVTEGWPAILGSLKSLLETGRAIDFKWDH